MRWKSFFRTTLLFSSSFMVSIAWAYDEPAVNLGYTSFFDGGPPAGPGFYYQDYLQYYATNRFNDNKGNRIPLPEANANVTANTVQFIYVTKKRLLGGNLGFSVLLPWVTNANVEDGLNNQVLRAQTGQGNLFFGPAIQFDPVMRKDGKTPLLVQRIDLDILAPTGEYNRNFAINPGSNFWSLNPYWALTVWLTEKWSASWRLHYLWNARNNDPNVSFGPMARTTQAGQAFFGNIATNYQITDKFFLGINSYFFDQFTDTKVNGNDVSGRKEKVWAIGPGLLYNITKNNFLFVNYYSEQDARNRTQGSNLILRYAVHFG